MTLISNDPPFVFVHVPKTGGSSVKSALAKYGSDEWIAPEPATKHLTIAEIRAERPRGNAAIPLTWSVVRDPRDRLASLFDYVRSNPFHPQYVDAMRLDFATFVRCRRGMPKSSMADYLTVEGALSVDLVIRYEDLPARWPELLRRIGVDEQIALPEANVSVRDAETRWTEGLLADVAEGWAVDFEIFGYDPSSPPGRHG